MTPNETFNVKQCSYQATESPSNSDCTYAEANLYWQQMLPCPSVMLDSAPDALNGNINLLYRTITPEEGAEGPSYSISFDQGHEQAGSGSDAVVTNYIQLTVTGTDGTTTADLDFGINLLLSIDSTTNSWVNLYYDLDSGEDYNTLTTFPMICKLASDACEPGPPTTVLAGMTGETQYPMTTGADSATNVCNVPTVYKLTGAFSDDTSIVMQGAILPSQTELTTTAGSQTLYAWGTTTQDSVGYPENQSSYIKWASPTGSDDDASGAISLASVAASLLASAALLAF